MGSKFERNNIISDSDSDIESPEKSLKDVYRGSGEETVLISSSDSDCESVIQDSISDISKIEADSPRRVIEESITTDSSLYRNSNIHVSVAQDSTDGGFISSFSPVLSEESNNSSSDEDVKICGEVFGSGNHSRKVSETPESTRNSSPNSSPESMQGLVINESSNYDTSDSTQKSASSVSLENVDRSLLEKQRTEKEAVYRLILKAVRGCDLEKLRDGGKLLKEKMLRCKEELEDQENSLQTSFVKSPVKMEIDNAADKESTTSWGSRIWFRFFRELTEKLKGLPVLPDESPTMGKHEIRSKSLFSSEDHNIQNLGRKGLQTHRVEAALTMDAVTRIHQSLETCPDQNTFEKDPKGLKVELMQHQRHALAWLLWREKQIPAGGILADDMGLGKTLSIIALVLRSEEYKRENNNESETEDERSVQIVDGIRTFKGKTLVVCPASLVGQWEQQIKKHCKSNILTVTIHHGRTRETQPKKLAGYDIVITTYGVLAEENKHSEDRKRGYLFRVRWERIVLDEAHIIRNHKTQKAAAACELSGTYRWCLTGTPVHNRQLDLYSLLKFIRCSPFDDFNVWKRWVENKASGVERVKTVIKAILLRRTKEDLTRQGQMTDLPNKNFIPVYVDLDEEELSVYHEVLTFSKSLLAEYLRQRGFDTDSDHKNIERIRSHLKGVEDVKATDVFVLLLRLRQICCIPGLIHSFLEKETCVESGIEPDDPVIEDLYSQLNRMSISAPKEIKETYDKEKMKNVLHKSNPVFRMDRASTKIQAMLNVIKEILPTSDKIVIVSQWTKVLKKLETHIRLLNIKCVSLDGSVPVASRTTVIEQFNQSDNNIRIMLLSLNAGGVGLNLTGGNRLIIFEPHWNPQLESQACDRVYRIGQRKEVYIYKILCRGTIEEKIELLQKQKLELASNLLSAGDRSHSSQMKQLTLNDLATLFDV